ncbi:MAG: hypothetical protein PVH38_01360 [Gammaproteobacteria bacterium]
MNTDSFTRQLRTALPWQAVLQGMACGVFAVMLATPRTAAAEQIDAYCMQDQAGFELNCTANDIQISGVAKNPDGTDRLEILDDGCAYPGDSVTFTATFDVVVTAKARHDVGIYFVTDGDPDGDGAISGACNISTMPYAPAPDWLDLDGTSDPFPGTNIVSNTQDTCGDIDKPDHNPLNPTVTLTATCVDSDGDGFLNLPNCTSWRQSGANELCDSPAAAYPGAPSKCRCDDSFQLPIEVPPAKLLVTKTANPATLDEPGGPATFTVAITNIGIDPNNPVTLYALTDDIHGDLNGRGDCSVPQTIPADDANPGGVDTYTCSFTANVSGNAGDAETDTVTAMSTDARGNQVSGSDTATVTILDVQPGITVNKTANPAEILEPGGQVSFTVTVNNNSVSSDPVSITMLTDDIHGDLNGQGDCSTPQTIAAGGSYACTFSAAVTGNYLDFETDTVTASGADDDSSPVSGSDSATVNITNVLSSITLNKTVDKQALDEPGGNVTYTYLIRNTSSVDTVTIDSLTDDKLSDLDGQGDCLLPQVLIPGQQYSCTVTASLSGNAFTSMTNVATARGVDDDGAPVDAMDNAVVNFNNVPPAASLEKTVTAAVVSYQVTVRNLSDAESLTLDSLGDDIYGNIADADNTAIISTTCEVPQILAPAGQAGDSYRCSFDALASGSPTTDTVTGSVSDDDGSVPVTPQDSATISWQ